MLVTRGNACRAGVTGLDKMKAPEAGPSSCVCQEREQRALMEEQTEGGRRKEGCFLTASSPCPTPDRIPAVGRTAPDSFGSSSPSEETCPSESEEQEVKSVPWRSGSGSKRRCIQRRYLLDLGLHGGGDGCWRDKLECGCGVVGILSRKFHHQVDLMAAKVSRHHAAAVHSVHLQHTTLQCDVTSCLTVFCPTLGPN